jgi:DNA-binding NtrC family response regulator
MSLKSHAVIVVDDDVRSLDQARIILDCTHNVLATGDANRAMAWLRSNATVNAIIVAQNLGGGKALEVLGSAQNIRPEVRRILIASYSDLAIFVEGLHSGAVQRTISKPFDATELLGLVRVRAMSGPARSAGPIAAA